MRKSIAIVFALAVTALSWPQTLVAGSVTGTINQLIVRDSDGLTYFTISGTPTGKPACATHSYWMIKDENSEAGKKQFSLLLAAKLSGLSIAVTGANTCTRWGDGEDVLSIIIQ